jgi:hypothetical protein
MRSKGHLEQYGGRRMYVPPFIHQYLNGCTMTAAAMGANIASFGTHPATVDESLQLGWTVGPKPDGGYNTVNMIDALGARYGLKLRKEKTAQTRWAKRLGYGSAVLLGIRYGDLDPLYRAPGFEDCIANHRVLGLGYDEDKGTTRMLDPLQRGTTHRGIDVPLAHLYEVVSKGEWADCEVWIKEGQAVLTTLTITARFDPVRLATLHATPARTFMFWDPTTPGLVAGKQRPTTDLQIPFDARGLFVQSVPGLDPKGGPFLRVAKPGSKLDGLWLEVTDGVEADLTVGVTEPPECGELVAAAVDQERAAWLAWLSSSPDIEPPPNNDPGTDVGAM